MTDVGEFPQMHELPMRFNGRRADDSCMCLALNHGAGPEKPLRRDSYWRLQVGRPSIRARLWRHPTLKYF